MDIHFIDVGFGNMTFLVMPQGPVIFCDCNITDDNKDRVLTYVKSVIGPGKPISVFITSHRDPDHMRGIKLLHAQHTIKEIWDSGVEGADTESAEYKAYMDLRRIVTSREIEARKYWDFGDTRLRCMNSKREGYTNPHEQSIVLKIQYKDSSALLAGDTTVRAWKEKILTDYSDEDLKASILLASHHGSMTFFEDPADAGNPFTAHMEKINPEMTLISIGPNVHNLPDKRAIELYESYSTGSSKGNKIYMTADKGTMKMHLEETGGWSLATKQ